MKKAINVVSAFDGMGCLYIALKEAGIKVNKYFAIETDKFAIQQTKHNFPDIIHLGDINNVTTEDFRSFKIDLFAGGSPCQGFSFAGAGLNFDDPRSALFFEYVRILKELKEKNPDIKFLLENVNMKREHLGVISKYLEIYPVRINSNLVSAQNRDRFYWTNIKTRKEGFFDELWSDIPQPRDRGILLKDILQFESEINEKYYLKDKEILRGIEKHSGKQWKSGNRMGNMDFPNNEYKKAKCITTIQIPGDRSVNHIKLDKNLKPKPNQDKASTFTDSGNHSDRTSDAPTEQRLEPKTDGKTNCLTNVGKDNLILVDFSHQNEGLRYYKEKAPTLNQRDYKEPRCITDGLKLRRLTPTECARLQTIPDWYKWTVSDTQVYRMLGNGWTVGVISHILSFYK